MTIFMRCYMQTNARYNIYIPILPTQLYVQKLALIYLNISEKVNVKLYQPPQLYIIKIELIPSRDKLGLLFYSTVIPKCRSPPNNFNFKH